MGDLVAHDRANHGNVVDDAANVGEQIADRNPTFTVASECPR